MNITQHIKNILFEETQNKKVKLVKQMIYDLFDNVVSIEESTYDDKPLLNVYFNSNSLAVNIELWFGNRISDEIMEMTGQNIIVCPIWWGEYSLERKNAEIFINTKLINSDD
jgi:hypothetical protein